MDFYYVLDIIFGAIFLIGGVGYWVVSRLFSDLNATYLPDSKEPKV